MKFFVAGFMSFLSMWVIGTLLFGLIVYLTKGSPEWYFAAPFGAILWAMVGVIGSEMSARKEKKINRNKELLSQEITDHLITSHITTSHVLATHIPTNRPTNHKPKTSKQNTPKHNY